MFSSANCNLSSLVTLVALLAITECSVLASELTFHPCDNISLTLDPLTLTGVSRVHCGSQCLMTSGCQAFSYMSNVCDIEVEGLTLETVVFAADGCFATKGFTCLDFLEG